MSLTALVSTPRGAAAVSLSANVVLVTLKLTVGLIIGSISVLADALDSTMDLLGAFVALAAVTYAAKPADRDHPYGHGKIESLSALAESALIFLATGFVAFEAIRRFGGDQEIDSIGLGIAAVSISLAVNILASAHLRRVSIKTGSPALGAAAQHRKSDIFTSLGVLIGLLLITVTPWNFLDSIVALGVATFVMWTGFRLFRGSFQEILDVRLSDNEEGVIHRILKSYANDFVHYFGMRTRRSGRARVIDFNLIVPRVMTVSRAHELTDSIEEDIDETLPGAIVSIHIEPCEVPMHQCNAVCPIEDSPLCYRERPVQKQIAQLDDPSHHP